VADSCIVVGAVAAALLVSQRDVRTGAES
jgi:hypothetical protein